MVTQQREEKITYSTMSVEQADAFNQKYDAALEVVRGQLGREYPVYINNEAVTTDEPRFEDRSPNDTRLLLGTFQECKQPEADRAVAAARAAFPGWSAVSRQDRVKLMRGAAEIFRQRKYDISA